MWNAGLDEAEAGIKIARKNINNLRYADDTTLMAEGEEKLKSVLMKVKEESKKVGLKLSIKKMKIMTCSPITSCQKMGKQWKQWETLFSWAPKSRQMVTVALKLKDACSLEESYDKPRQHIKKQRHHFINKSPYSQSYHFIIGVWELERKEGWASKNSCTLIVVLEKTL